MLSALQAVMAILKKSHGIDSHTQSPIEREKMEYIQSRQPKRHIIYISLLVFGFCCVFSGRQAFARLTRGPSPAL